MFIQQPNTSIQPPLIIIHPLQQSFSKLPYPFHSLPLPAETLMKACDYATWCQNLPIFICLKFSNTITICHSHFNYSLVCLNTKNMSVSSVIICVFCVLQREKTYFPNNFLISFSFINASTGVRVLISVLRISSLI